MNDQELNDVIYFSDQKEYIENRLGKEEWITVYQVEKLKRNGYKDDICFYPCLVAEEKKNKFDKDPHQWISFIGYSKPGITEYNKPLRLTDKIKQFICVKYFYHQIYPTWIPSKTNKKNQEKNKIMTKVYVYIQNCIWSVVKKFIANYKMQQIKKYTRYSEEGIEPLVHIREFSNYPSYIEVSEEFCHYFNLYEDSKNKVFLSFDESSNPIEVIKVVHNNNSYNQEVKIKKKYLNEFLFVKKMWLCVQFDNRRNIYKNLKKEISEDFFSKNNDYIYSLNSGNKNWVKGKTLIKFMGKKFIKYKKPQRLHYENDLRYEEFSFIDYKTGDEKSWTCDPNKLSDDYGKNPKAPHYLTPVSFRKDVLKKYYDKLNQYSVDEGNSKCSGFWSSDGYLKCHGSWGMEIDVQDKRVVVYLGDLSKIPYDEQKYWKSYNIAEQAKISREKWERDFECKFTQTNRPDLFFKNLYKAFNKKWEEKYNWPFFKPLSNNDQYCFSSLRIPLNEEQSEFDNQVIHLTKVFIESINQEKIKKDFPAQYEKNAQSISVLDTFLKSKNIQFSQMVEFLKKLQQLRSKGSAHRKTEDYDKTLSYFKQLKNVSDPESKIQIFSQILILCIRTINSLDLLFLKEYADKDKING